MVSTLEFPSVGSKILHIWNPVYMECLIYRQVIFDTVKTCIYVIWHFGILLT